MKKGFTLVEILVAIAVVAILGTIFLLIFNNTLKGSNKSQILAVIKQNGQAILENMDKSIRGADNVVCRTPTGQTLVIVKNGVYTRFRFVPPGNTNAARGTCGSLLGTANGCIQQDTPIQPASPSPRSTIQEFISTISGICNDLDPLMAPITTLTNTNTQSGVSVECVTSTCTNPPIFARSEQSGFKNSVTVSFILKPGVDMPAAISDQIDSVNFQTTIGLR